MLNQTSVIEFLLLGLTDIQDQQPFLFAVFLTIYLVNVAGNGAILMIVISDPRLHSPMHFFLGNLSCLYICYSTVTLPKMLENFLSTHKAISFMGCISQLHFFHFLGSTEAMLLAVMAFDHFVDICKPLHYTVIMNPQLCTQMAITIWATGLFYALLHSIMTSHLNFCGPNHIHLTIALTGECQASAYKIPVWSDMKPSIAEHNKWDEMDWLNPVTLRVTARLQPVKGQSP
nr:olfactory receptor 12D1-like [Marmota flaviventris]